MTSFFFVGVVVFTSKLFYINMRVAIVSLSFSLSLSLSFTQTQNTETSRVTHNANEFFQQYTICTFLLFHVSFRFFRFVLVAKANSTKKKTLHNAFKI